MEELATVAGTALSTNRVFECGGEILSQDELVAFHHFSIMNISLFWLECFIRYVNHTSICQHISHNSLNFPTTLSFYVHYCIRAYCLFDEKSLPNSKGNPLSVIISETRMRAYAYTFHLRCYLSPKPLMSYQQYMETRHCGGLAP